MTTTQYIKENIDIKGLIDIGFLQEGMTTKEIEKRICKYFELETIFECTIAVHPEPFSLN